MIKKIEKLIESYESKVKLKTDSISKINSMISDSIAGETESDIEDLKEEKTNAIHDRNMFINFISDLKKTLQLSYK